MLRRHPNHSFLLVAAATKRPLLVYRGLPRPEKCVRAAEGNTLVYDLGPLPGKDHGRLLDALALLRNLPYLAEGAPSLLLVGGAPAMVIDERGKEVKEGVGGRVLDLLGIR
jgi:hypothetical protein